MAASAERPRLDFLLRLRPDIEAEHEAATRDLRLAMMARVILIGALLYNVYGICCYFLLPDIYVEAVLVRLLVVTPPWIAFWLALPRLSLVEREFLPLVGMVGVVTVTVGQFLLSAAPHSPYFLTEMLVVLVHANMLLLLRFRFALTLALLASALLTAGVLLKAGLDPGLRIALIMQGVIGFAFTAYANWYTEYRRSRAFLAQRDMSRRVETAERMGERLRGLSLTDPLTDLPNRRHLEEHFARLAGEGRKLTLMMVDIDHFKPYNDRLGHAAGDICLKRVSGGLAAYAAATGGFAARFGGEEFTLLYEGEADAERAEGVIAAVRALAIGHPGRPDGVPVVTISLGLATATAGRRRFFDLVTEADRALYEAKRAGRDRVQMAA